MLKEKLGIQTRENVSPRVQGGTSCVLIHHHVEDASIGYGRLTGWVKRNPTVTTTRVEGCTQVQSLSALPRQGRFETSRGPRPCCAAQCYAVLHVPPADSANVHHIIDESSRHQGRPPLAHALLHALLEVAVLTDQRLHRRVR